MRVVSEFPGQEADLCFSVCLAVSFHMENEYSYVETGGCHGLCCYEIVGGLMALKQRRQKMMKLKG